MGVLRRLYLDLISYFSNEHLNVNPRDPVSSITFQFTASTEITRVEWQGLDTYTASDKHLHEEGSGKTRLYYTLCICNYVLHVDCVYCAGLQTSTVYYWSPDTRIRTCV